MNNARVALEHRYIEKTHGAEKYECLKVSGTTISGSHYTSEDSFWGTVEYVLESSDSQLTSNRPSGCFVDANDNVYYNDQDVVGKTLLGTDMVVCERIAIEVNVTIPSAAFQDEAGNDVEASSIFHWSYDGQSPTLSISARGVPTKISYLVVGGGGGGASGGGGGGGVIEELDVSFDCADNPQIEITVGSGGIHGYVLHT